MKMAHNEFKFMFDVSENRRNMLVVESAPIFREMIIEIRNVLDGNESKVVLSEGGELLKKFEAIDLILNPFDITMNSKKIQTKLYEVIRKEINDTELWMEYNQLCQHMEEYVLKVLEELEYECAYDDKVDIQTILKALNVRLDEDYIDLTERMIEYIRIASGLIRVKFFIFINIHTYFNEYEIRKIYEFAEYNKISLFLIESRLSEDISQYSQIIVIDKEGCEIELNVR